MADEQARRARRMELLTQYRALERREAELRSQFKHQPTEEMTYEDYVYEADLTIEMDRLRAEMRPLLQELRDANLWR